MYKKIVRKLEEKKMKKKPTWGRGRADGARSLQATACHIGFAYDI
jgi:hypothetical protein